MTPGTPETPDDLLPLLPGDQGAAAPPGDSGPDAAPGINSTQLAERWGVTGQTVLNYLGQGMPTLGKHGREWRFDPGACESWKAEHKPQSVHGGRRARVGRKRTMDKPQGTVFEEAHRQGLARPGDEAAVREILKDVKGPEDVLRLMRQGKLSPIVAKTLTDAVDAAQTMTELERERGELIKASEVRDQWLRALSRAAESLHSLPARLERDLAAAGTLHADPQRAATARAVIEHAVEAVMAELAGAQLSSPPTAKSK